ncbi:MAG TPA: carboxypeptidase regulatory-like domain-containing protein [Thermoplasmata archaeon]|nr:carboxypeptidase regulatory-like domain-containing protein [Thermoplasmata archaeon]
MAGTWATGRCPSCGTPLAAMVPAAPGARWFPCAHCGSPVAVVPPTNPPPIFSWEVFPLVYPPLPPLRVPGRSVGRLAAVALVASTLLLAGLAGALVYSGVRALGPTTFDLSGTVMNADLSAPVGGASVVLTSETGAVRTGLSSPNGAFAFSGISAGGATLNVSAPGYTTLTYDLFFSPTYSATGGGTGPLQVALVPGASANATVVYESPFATLESFVSSVWSAAALLGIAAIFAGIGGVAAARRRHAPFGVAGGLGAALAPVALTVLGITAAFPLASAPAAAVVCLGVVGASLQLLPIVWSGQAAESG